MSLLSQKDREMVIEALESYVSNLNQKEHLQKDIQSYNALLNWIRLEYHKHE